MRWEQGMRRFLITLIIAAAVLALSSCGAGGGTGGGAGAEAGGEEPMNQDHEAVETEQSSESMSGYTAEHSYEYAAVHPAYLKENETDTEEINCWGDSITEGYGSDGLTYPEVLEELTGIPVRNLGVGGEDSMEILRRSVAYGSQEEDILVIQMGDNGGWRDIRQLIRQYHELITKSGTDRYIIISSTDDPNDFDQIWGYTMEPVGLENTWYEEAFEKEFGEHLFNGRKYLIEHGLQLNGLRRTETDYMRAKRGYISLQLRNPWIDNTHLNEDGYYALAYGVFEKGKELGYG